MNLLRTARANPKLSAFAYIFGQFDYMRTPLVPPGTKIIAHLKPGNRPTWSPNGEEGWTIGPALEHYRCLRCYFPATKSERNVDTVTFIPKMIPFPKLDLDGFLKQSIKDRIKILTSDQKIPG